MNKTIKKESLSSKKMIAYILNLINSFKDTELKDLCNLFIDEYGKKLEYYPSGKGHHAYVNGMLSHIYNMLKQGEAIVNIYPLNRDLLLTGILLHDCGKLVTNNYDKDEQVLKLTKESILLQHLIQGVLVIERLSSKINISNEKILLIQHMISAHHGRPEWGSQTYPAFPEAQALHNLDALDSRMDIMFNEISKLDSNTMFTDEIPKLNNRILYKHNFD